MSLGLVRSAAVEKPSITLVSRCRMLVGESSPVTRRIAVAAANVVMRQMKIVSRGLLRTCDFARSTAGFSESSGRTGGEMDLVGSSGSVEIFVAAGVLLSTRVPASAFAASDTCPSQKSRMLEPSAAELMIASLPGVGGVASLVLSHVLSNRA